MGEKMRKVAVEIYKKFTKSSPIFVLTSGVARAFPGERLTTRPPGGPK